MSNNLQDFYDAVPYPQQCFVESHPDRLATIAKCFGHTPPSLSSSKVLELGCGSGGNLHPMALSLPGCSFLGIDLSSTQINEAKRIAAEAALDKIHFIQGDISALPPSLGKFDYIVAHGLFSWVSYEVQEKLFSVLKNHLEPSGLAYVSYNLYPGWRLRTVTRDIAQFFSARGADARKALAQTQSTMELCLQNAERLHPAYRTLIESEHAILDSADANYLQHEYLEPSQEPTLFIDFVDRAKKHELRFLSEATLGTMADSALTPSTQQALRAMTNEMVLHQQLLDFVTGRSFRQSILCHEAVRLERTVDPRCVREFWVGSGLVPAGDVKVLRNKEMTFQSARGETLKASHPVLIGALMSLSPHWPRWIRFADLLARTRELLNVSGISWEESFQAELESMLFQLYRDGVVEFHLTPPAFHTTLSREVRASALARLRAATSTRVPNLRHEMVDLSEVDREVLLELDGTKPFDAASMAQGNEGRLSSANRLARAALLL